MFKKIFSISLCSLMILSSIGTNFIKSSAMFQSSPSAPPIQNLEQPEKQAKPNPLEHLDEYDCVLNDEDCLVSVFISKNFTGDFVDIKSLVQEACQIVFNRLGLKLDRQIPLFFNTEENILFSNSYWSKPFYVPFYDIICIPDNAFSSYDDCMQVIAHEIVHAIIKSFLIKPTSIPIWMHEGLATEVSAPKELSFPFPSEIICISNHTYNDMVKKDTKLNSHFYSIHQYIIKRWLALNGNEVIQTLAEYVNNGGKAEEFFLNTNGQVILNDFNSVIEQFNYLAQ